MGSNPYFFFLGGIRLSCIAREEICQGVELAGDTTEVDIKGGKVGHFKRPIRESTGFSGGDYRIVLCSPLSRSRI
jgi:hypothetical protein